MQFPAVLKPNRAETEGSATRGGSAFSSRELPVEMVVIQSHSLRPKSGIVGATNEKTPVVEDGQTNLDQGAGESDERAVRSARTARTANCRIAFARL
jgi:hypothetical protein